MKYTVITIIFTLFANFCLGQATADSIVLNDNYIIVYVTSKKKIMLYGEKSNLQKLEKHLQSTIGKKAKIGTLKPTPLDVFVVFEQVVKMLNKYDIESDWYSDPEFSSPFFEDVNERE